MGDHDGSTLDYVLARASDPDIFARWEAQGRSARWCRRPVRLVGRTAHVEADTGEVVSEFSTLSEPDGTLVKACGQRRQTACPPCSSIYRGDAWHLIVAGLRGGKGVPEDVALHPTLFVTLTAPSFGAVHSQRDRGGVSRTCRPHARGTCLHGRARRCGATHESDASELGEPLCVDCFEYSAAVLWNALATELWRRTTIAIGLRLAGAAGLTATAFGRVGRVSFAKVIEYQRRGVVHLHVVVRLDGREGVSAAPPSEFTVAMLEQAVQRAVSGAAVPFPSTAGVSGHARWGSQLDIRRIRPDENAERAALAAYVAKYATKSTDAFGRLDRRLRARDIASLDVPPHLRRLVLTAWELGGRPELEHLRLRAWAHTLGFRGHWLTKSRRYSTTFGSLRGARERWRRGDEGEMTTGSPVVLKDWRFVGRGWANPGDKWLAETAAAEAVEARRLARQELAQSEVRGEEPRR